MSRIGKKLIKLEKGCLVQQDESIIIVTGPKGEIRFAINPNFIVETSDGFVSVKIKELADPKAKLNALHGLYGSLLKNALSGVHEGFTKKLLLVGVGYKAQAQSKKLTLALGFSHPIEFIVPDGLTVVCPDPTTIEISGIKKDQVGQFSAEVRSIRPPEPYKGKGVMYQGEKIRRKVGKAGKK